MAFTYQDIDTFIEKVSILKNNYTLAGAAALILCLKHRSTDDLDLYLESESWDEDKTPFLLFKAFEQMIPTNDLLKVINHIKHSGMNVTKIHFEKGHVAIIQNGPMTLINRHKINFPNKLSVATIYESALGKIAAIGERDKDVDLLDLGHIFQTDIDIDINDVIENVGKRRMEFFSFEKAFSKLAQIEKLDNITQSANDKMRSFGAEGLRIIKAKNI